MQLEKHAKLISDQFKTTEERTLSSMRFSTEIGGRGGGGGGGGGWRRRKKWPWFVRPRGFKKSWPFIVKQGTHRSLCSVLPHAQTKNKKRVKRFSHCSASECQIQAHISVGNFFLLSLPPPPPRVHLFVWCQIQAHISVGNFFLLFLVLFL